MSQTLLFNVPMELSLKYYTLRCLAIVFAFTSVLAFGAGVYTETILLVSLSTIILDIKILASHYPAILYFVMKYGICGSVCLRYY